jgi:hypothetical protein
MTVDDHGQLLQHREREEEVSHEMKSREGRGRARRRLPPGAGESGSDPAQSDDSRWPPVLGNGKAW